MTDSGQRTDPKFEIEDELDFLFANASPNPNREGCPPREALIGLSRREKPVGHPDYLHIVRCSPCFREFRAIQRAARAKARVRLWASAAAAIFLFSTATWIARRDRATAPAGRQSASTPVSVDRVATLDLRPYAATRGDDRKADLEPLVMTPGPLDATLLLPVGSEPGSYEVRILDQDLRVQTSSRSSATIRDYITTLRTVIDLSALPAGQYQLALKRDGGEWQMFPLQIR